MSFVVDEAVEKYAEEHSTPAAELFTRLAAETRETQTAPQMMVGPLEGAFLSFVVGLKRPQLVLEIGTFTGWSSIAMASALPPGGTLVTCDVNEETSAIARRYAEEAGVADRIEYRLGPALETLATLDGPFDLVFIDADKPGYIDYYEAVLPKLADGGVILADNTLSGGNVIPPNGEMAEAITRFNDHVRADARVDCVVLTIRDGITMIRATLSRQLAERAEHDIGLSERLVVGRVARVRDREHAHPRRLGRADAAVRVLDRSAALRADAEAACGLEVDVRRRLAARDLLGGDGRREVRRQPRLLERRVNELAVRRRRQPEWELRRDAADGVDRAGQQR